MAEVAEDRTSFYELLTGRLRTIANSNAVDIWILGLADECMLAMSSHLPADDRANVFGLTGEQFLRTIKLRRANQIESGGNFATFVAPIFGEEESEKVISFTCETTEPQLAAVYCDLLTAIAEIASGFERRMALIGERRRFEKLERPGSAPSEFEFDDARLAIGWVPRVQR